MMNLFTIFDFIKKNLLFMVVVVLIILLVIGRCDGPTPDPAKPIIHIDTVYVPHTDTVPGKPQILWSKPEIVIEPQYLPDPNYDKLKQQYADLLDLYFRKNLYKDTLKIDSVGFVYVTDTINRNKIAGRIFSYNLKYPIITKTITNPPISRNQLYIGGAIQGNLTNPVSQMSVGFMLKNKKDQLFGVYGATNVDGQISIGLQSYWKIHIGK